MRTMWTDLAMEGAGAPPGESLTGGVERTTVVIDSEEQARALGRPMGRYVTLGCPQRMSVELGTRRALSEALGETISAMLPQGARTMLVTGLGNRSVTPDALGPRTVERVLVTRHMAGCLPEDVEERMASVCAASPGVLGVTGVETAEVLRGIAAHVRPDAIIAVDALAARSSSRIASTIQVTDTGITPGSGVGNHQRALTRETMGAPVIAVGVPMVVSAWAIASDALLAMNGDGDVDEEQLTACVERVVTGELGEMIVTPREVDALVERMAGVVAEGINLALHPRLTRREVAQLMAQ